MPNGNPDWARQAQSGSVIEDQWSSIRDATVDKARQAQSGNDHDDSMDTMMPRDCARSDDDEDFNDSCEDDMHMHSDDGHLQ